MVFVTGSTLRPQGSKRTTSTFHQPPMQCYESLSWFAGALSISFRFQSDHARPRSDMQSHIFKHCQLPSVHSYIYSQYNKYRKHHTFSKPGWTHRGSSLSTVGLGVRWRPEKRSRNNFKSLNHLEKKHHEQKFEIMINLKSVKDRFQKLQ